MGHFPAGPPRCWPGRPGWGGPRLGGAHGHGGAGQRAATTGWGSARPRAGRRVLLPCLAGCVVGGEKFRAFFGTELDGVPFDLMQAHGAEQTGVLDGEVPGGVTGV